MASPETKPHLVKTLVTTIGSVAAVATVARTIVIDYCPPEVREFLYSGLKDFLKSCSRDLTVVIDEYHRHGENEHFSAAQTYLLSRVSSNLQCVKIGKNPGEKNTTVTLEAGKTFKDTFKGVKFNWFLGSKKTSRAFHDDDDHGCDHGSFELTFPRKYKDLALNEYLPFIREVVKTMNQEEKMVKLSTVADSRWWKSVKLDHPATFDTLALAPDVKEMVKNDLDQFLESREYYRKLGKAWKRGYLLYGPPGTGKSSMIAAMANYLKFDIYDLELTAIETNSDLRRLLVATANRSLIVVEDIDCTVELHDRAGDRVEGNKDNKVTLSGFLNFIDGLWSSCGDERIIIFTTNHKEKLDPALLRPGRMDVHIHMSYCTVSVFRLMAENYLGVTDHDSFQKIEHLMGRLEITPAEVGEQLLRDRDPDIALGGLIKYMNQKLIE